jgi:DNA cross-link repair 1A protein
MFLFRINKSKYILHTGDFRASNELVEELLLKRIKLDIIYLDTTYLDSYYKFLPQSEIIKLGIDLVKKELASKPNALITCGSYTIGKERIFIGLYNLFMTSKIKLLV